MKIKGILFGLFKSLLVMAGIFIVSLALLLNSARFILNLIPDKTQLLAAVVTGWLHQPLHIKEAVLSGSAIHPKLILNNVELKNPKDPQHPLLRLNQLIVTLDLWRSAWHRAWITDYLVIDGLSLVNQSGESRSSDHKKLLDWVLSQPEIVFKNVNMDWQVSNTALPIRDLTLLIKNNNDNHVLAGHVVLAHTVPTHLNFIYKMQAKNINDPLMRGILYLNGKNIQLSQWLSFLPDLVKQKNLSLQSGKADIKLWAHLVDHEWQSVQVMGTVDALGGGFHPANWSITPIHFNAITYLQNHMLGALKFRSDDMQLVLSSFFSHPLSHLKMNGQVEWLHHNAQWQVSLPHFHLADAHLQLATKLKLLLATDQKPQIDLLGNVSLDSVSYLSQYLPDHLLSPALVKWLETALVHGKVADGKFLLQGPLTAFPFNQHNGHFEVSAHLKNVGLRYLDKWPMLSNFNGNLVFDNRGMRIHAKNAMVIDNPIQTITATIDNLSHADLIVKAESKTDLAKGLEFLKHSQLAIAKDMDSIQGVGPIQADLTLNLPLFHGHGKASVQGQVAFLRNDLRLQQLNLSLTHLMGRLHFKNDLLSAEKLQAQLFGEPILIGLQTKQRKNSESSLHVTVDGAIDLRTLAKRLPSYVAHYMSGRTMAHVELVLHDVRSTLQNTIRVFSNLNGITIDNVPPPFAKKSQTVWPTRLVMTVPRNGFVNLAVKVSDVLSGQFQLNHSPAELVFHAGNILIGPGNAMPAATPGLTINGYVPVVDASVWQQWFEKMKGDDERHVNKQVLPDFFKRLNLTIGNLIAADQQWKDILLNVAPAEKGILVQLQNDKVSGKIILPNIKAQPIYARFDYLFLHPQKSDVKGIIDPQKIPALDLKIDDFRVKGVPDGSITLLTVPLNHGLLIKKLHAKTRLFSLDVQGKWTAYDTHAQTELVGKFESEDLGAFLLDRHLSSRLQGGILSSSFDLKWFGAPDQFQLGKTNGKLSFSLQEGRILQLNTETESNLELGRLLNLLSLESVSHFLTFDFSSLTKKGFPFHVVEGEFNVKRGDIFTNHVNIDGPLANVQVSGRIGLTGRENDLTLVISPYVSSSLPVIVGLAGGPVAGLTAWIANKILEPGVGHLMRITYQVTGSWQKPVVKKLSS